MYDATSSPSFEHVEMEMQTQFAGIRDVSVGGFTKDEKSVKRIIGDMEHTYYITFHNYDEVEHVKKVEEVVEVLAKKFPDTHFQVTASKDNVGEIQGAYLRVGATPPTNVSLAAEAIDEILGKGENEKKTEAEASAE